ncbi:hypothetical protein NMY22_g17123 [Coprinellus aureogranulatus]|nr:hypothetical protein NMY22_g17123 [Coprinellus aureogranulatus]
MAGRTEEEEAPEEPILDSGINLIPVDASAGTLPPAHSLHGRQLRQRAAQRGYRIMNLKVLYSTSAYKFTTSDGSSSPQMLDPTNHRSARAVAALDESSPSGSYDSLVQPLAPSCPPDPSPWPHVTWLSPKAPYFPRGAGILLRKGLPSFPLGCHRRNPRAQLPALDLQFHQTLPSGPSSSITDMLRLSETCATLSFSSYGSMVLLTMRRAVGTAGQMIHPGFPVVEPSSTPPGLRLRTSAWCSRDAVEVARVP